MTTPTLEELIAAGDARAVAQRVSSMSASERRSHRPAIRRAWNITGWRGDLRVTAKQAATWAAHIGLGTRRDAMATSPPDDDFAFFVLSLYNPDWLHDYLLAALPERFALARRMERAGYVSFASRPDRWVLGLMAFGRQPASALLDALRADPDLIADIPRLFRLEGAGVTSMTTMAQGGGWLDALAALAEDGTLTRAQLLDDTLHALKAGFSNYHASWYRNLHQRLAPSPSERSGRTSDYLSLLGADAAPTVDLALGVLESVHALTPLDPEALAAALAPAMLQSSRSLVRRAMRLLDAALPGRAGARDAEDPERALRIVGKVADALGHPDAQLRAMWIETFLLYPIRKIPEAQRKTAYDAWSPLLPPEDQPALRSRLGLPPPSAVAPPPPIPVASPLVASPRAPDRLVLPTTPAEVRRAFEMALERPEDVLLVEAALAGAVNVGATADDVIAAAVAEYVETMVDYPRNNATLMVAMVAHAWASGGTYPRYETPNEDPDDPFAIFAWSRIEAVARHVHRGCRLPLLSTPTHDDMTIDAQVLVARVEAWATSDERADRFDLALAFARVAAGSHFEALASLQAAMERHGSSSFLPTGRPIPTRRGNALRRLVTFALGAATPFQTYYPEAATTNAALYAGARLVPGAGPDELPSLPQLEPPQQSDLRRQPDGRHPTGAVRPEVRAQVARHDLRTRVALRASERPYVWPHYLTWLGAAAPHEPTLLGGVLFRWLRRTIDDRSDEGVIPGLRLLGVLPGPLGDWGEHAATLALCAVDDRVRTTAVAVLIDALATGRTTPSGLGAALRFLSVSQVVPVRRLAAPLSEVAEASSGHATCVRETLQSALHGPRDALHKDVPTLLTLWSRLVDVVGPSPLTPENRALLESFPRGSAGARAAAPLIAQHPNA